nr:SDR family NAD(P)-dependent oxidoreductase [Prescottella equi]
MLVNQRGWLPRRRRRHRLAALRREIVALNLLAPAYMAQAANLVMRRTGDRRCDRVNIGSVSAHQPQPCTAAYTAAKAGLSRPDEGLALEWAPKVRVNHIPRA